MVRLYFEEQRGLKYISEHLGISYNTAKSRLYRSDTYRAYKKGNLSVAKRVFEQVEQGRLYTPEELLAEHGYDPDKWRAKSSTSNNWGKVDEQGKMQYQHKISVVPKELAPTPEELISIISKYNTVFDIDCVDDEKLEMTYVLNMADLHFGLNTAEDYHSYQTAVLRDLENQYKEVILLNLGDYLHVNDLKSRTANDTRISDTNFQNMWEEGLLFIDPIIQHALRNSPNVRYIFNRGNHDEASSWAFTQLLKERYPQMEVDDSMKLLKCVTFDEVAIFTTHGHVKKNNIAQLCATLYPMEWAKAKARFLFTGHLHQISDKDLTGIVHFQQPTPSKHTDYEDDNLFLGSKKGMFAFTFYDDDVASIRNLR